MSAGTNNYIYISHLDKDHQYWKLPCCPSSITDTMESTFQATQALGRSAPVYTYSYSGPRVVNVDLHFRIDAFDDENANNPTAINSTAAGEYMLDGMVRALQSISLPKYSASNKAIEPPLVALRLSNEVFIKGIVTSPIQLTYELPIIYGDRYAQVRLSLSITEVDPYDAATVFQNGSFRGVVKTLRDGMGFDTKSKASSGASSSAAKTAAKAKGPANLVQKAFR